MASRPDAHAVIPIHTPPGERVDVGADQSAESAKPARQELVESQHDDLDRQLEAHETQAMEREDDPRHAPDVLQDDLWTDISPSDAEQGPDLRDMTAHQETHLPERRPVDAVDAPTSPARP